MLALQLQHQSLSTSCQRNHTQSHVQLLMALQTCMMNLARIPVIFDLLPSYHHFGEAKSHAIPVSCNCSQQL